MKGFRAGACEWYAAKTAIQAFESSYTFLARAMEDDNSNPQPNDTKCKAVEANGFPETVN